jgi:hypothetical protein
MSRAAVVTAPALRLAEEEEQRSRDLIEDLQLQSRKAALHALSISTDRSGSLPQRGSLPGPFLRIKTGTELASLSPLQIRSESLVDVHCFMIYFEELGYDVNTAASLASTFAEAGMGAHCRAASQLHNGRLSFTSIQSVLTDFSHDDLARIGVSRFGEQRVLLTRIRQNQQKNQFDCKRKMPSAQQLVRLAVAVAAVEAEARAGIALAESQTLLALFQSAGAAFVAKKALARSSRALLVEENAARDAIGAQHGSTLKKIQRDAVHGRQLAAVADLAFEYSKRLFQEESKERAKLVKSSSADAAASLALEALCASRAALFEDEEIRRLHCWRLEASARYVLLDARTTAQTAVSPQHRIARRETAERLSFTRSADSWHSALMIREAIDRIDALRRTEMVRQQVVFKHAEQHARTVNVELIEAAVRQDLRMRSLLEGLEVLRSTLLREWGVAVEDEVTARTSLMTLARQSAQDAMSMTECRCRQNVHEEEDDDFLIVIMQSQRDLHHARLLESQRIEREVFCDTETVQRRFCEESVETTEREAILELEHTASGAAQLRGAHRVARETQEADEEECRQLVEAGDEPSARWMIIGAAATERLSGINSDDAWRRAIYERNEAMCRKMLVSREAEDVLVAKVLEDQGNARRALEAEQLSARSDEEGQEKQQRHDFVAVELSERCAAELRGQQAAARRCEEALETSKRDAIDTDEAHLFGGLIACANELIFSALLSWHERTRIELSSEEAKTYLEYLSAQSEGLKMAFLLTEHSRERVEFVLGEDQARCTHHEEELHSRSLFSPAFKIDYVTAKQSEKLGNQRRAAEGAEDSGRVKVAQREDESRQEFAELRRRDMQDVLDRLERRLRREMLRQERDEREGAEEAEIRARDDAQRLTRRNRDLHAAGRVEDEQRRLIEVSHDAAWAAIEDAAAVSQWTVRRGERLVEAMRLLTAEQDAALVTLTALEMQRFALLLDQCAEEQAVLCLLEQNALAVSNVVADESAGRAAIDSEADAGHTSWSLAQRRSMWEIKLLASSAAACRLLDESESAARAKAYEREQEWRDEFVDAALRSMEEALKRTEQNQRLVSVRLEYRERDALEDQEAAQRDVAVKLSKWGAARRALLAQERDMRATNAEEECTQRLAIEALELDGLLAFFTDLEQCGRSAVQLAEDSSRETVYSAVKDDVLACVQRIESRERSDGVAAREATERAALQKLFLSLRLHELKPSVEVYALLAAQMVENETVTLASGVDVTKKDLLELALTQHPQHAPSYVALAATLSGRETGRVSGRLLTKRQLCLEALSMDRTLHQAYFIIGAGMTDKETVQIPLLPAEDLRQVTVEGDTGSTAPTMSRVAVLAAGVCLCPEAPDGFLLLANALGTGEKITLHLGSSHTVTKTKKECFLEALRLEPTQHAAYFGLAQLLSPSEEVRVDGPASKTLTRKECFVQTILHNPSHPLARKSLAGLLAPDERIDFPDGSVVTRDNWNTTAAALRKAHEERSVVVEDEKAKRIDAELQETSGFDLMRQEHLRFLAAVRDLAEGQRTRVVEACMKAEQELVRREELAAMEKANMDERLIAGLISKAAHQQQVFEGLVAERVKLVKERKERFIRHEAERIAMEEARRKADDDMRHAEAPRFPKNAAFNEQAVEEGEDRTAPQPDETPEQTKARVEAQRIISEARELRLREEAELQNREDLDEQQRAAAATAIIQQAQKKESDHALRSAAIAEECVRHAHEFNARREEVATARAARQQAEQELAERDAELLRRHEARAGGPQTATATSNKSFASELPSDPHMRAMMEWLLPEHKRDVRIDRRRGQLTADAERCEREEAEARDAADLESMTARQAEDSLRVVDAFFLWHDSATRAVKEAERCARDALQRILKRSVDRQRRYEAIAADPISTSLPAGQKDKAKFDAELQTLMRLLLPRDKQFVNVDTRKGSLQTEAERRERAEQEEKEREADELREKAERLRTIQEEEALVVWEELLRKVVQEQDRATRCAAQRQLALFASRTGRFEEAVMHALEQLDRERALREPKLADRNREQEEQERDELREAADAEDTGPQLSPRPNNPALPAADTATINEPNDFQLVGADDASLFDAASTPEDVWTAMSHDVRGLIATHRLLPAWLELEKMACPPSASPGSMARHDEWVQMRREAREALLLPLPHWLPAKEPCPKNPHASHDNLGLLARDWQCLYCFKSLWCPDNKTCQKCGQATRVMARHHCRICGHTLCGKCARRGTKQSAPQGRMMSCIQEDVTMCLRCYDAKVGRSPSELSDATVPPLLLAQK